jgi:hypothetical protein
MVSIEGLLLENGGSAILSRSGRFDAASVLGRADITLRLIDQVVYSTMCNR